MQPSIRRCFNCNLKTHKMYWINGPECPVWHEVAGFSESMHGGLKPKMIENLRKVYINLKRLNEEINPEGTINNERGL